MSHHRINAAILVWGIFVGSGLTFLSMKIKPPERRSILVSTGNATTSAGAEIHVYSIKDGDPAARDACGREYLAEMWWPDMPCNLWIWGAVGAASATAPWASDWPTTTTNMTGEVRR